MSAATVLMMQQRKLVARFRQAGAIAPDAARPLSEVGARDGIALHRLCRREVIREPRTGRFYLDVATWEALQTRQRRLLAVLILASLAVLAFVLWTTPPR